MPSLRLGTVTALVAGPPPRATITLGGDTAATVDAPYLDSYSPAVGDVVSVLVVQGAPLVLGRAATAPARRTVRLSRAVQSIPNATVTAISWDTELEDSDGFIAVTGTTVTIPAGLGGMYAVTVNVIAAFAGRTFLDLVPTSGVAGMPAQFRVPLPVATEARGHLTVSLPLLAGDSFVVQFFHSTGSAINAAAWLSCVRTGP